MIMIVPNFKLAITALKAQKMRTFLTVLGIAIGIAVVITIMAADRGLNKLVMGQLDVFSPNTINIETKIPSTKHLSNENAFGQSTGITITTLNDKDIEAVKKHPNISSVYGLVMGQAIVKYGDETKTVLLWGEGANMPEVEVFNLSSGRIYTNDEENSLSQVAVLGSVVADKLFGADDPLNKTVYIKGKPFRVVGVAAKRGAVFGMDMDNVIYLPTKTMQKRILGIDYVRSIISKVNDKSKLKETVLDLQETIRDNHDIIDPDKDDFTVQTMEEASNILSSVINGLTFLLVALVCISLLVGGVGIMNIMYVSVSERTFEIGLRKAIGASNRDILWQFLIEAVTLTLLGGVAGVVLGSLLALLVYWLALYYQFSWVYDIPISSIALSIGFSAFVGLLFGIYPAKKAAALDPIEALRKE
jgi:putative ABC transport system permease protein